MSTKAGAAKAVKRLIEAGYLVENCPGYLAPTDRFFELPQAIEQIPAGHPSPVNGQVCDVILLSEYLVQHPDRSFAVTARGEAMIDAGIQDGDLVIVERRDAEPDDIVVTHSNDEGYTIKCLKKDAEGYYLSSTNANLNSDQPKTPRPKAELSIVGVVISLARKLK